MIRGGRHLLLVIALVASGFALMSQSAGCGFSALQNFCSVEHLSSALLMSAAVPDAALPERVAFAVVVALAVFLSFTGDEPAVETRAGLVLQAQRLRPELPRRLSDIFAFSPQLSAVRDF